jgi:hypothetical protein
MFDLQILRSTSFALVTTGWSPDDVDADLEGLCAQIEDATVDAGAEAARLREAEFEVSSPGYDPDDVRAFYSRLAADLEEAFGAAENPAPVEEPVAAEVEEPVVAEVEEPVAEEIAVDDHEEPQMDAEKIDVEETDAVEADVEPIAEVPMSVTVSQDLHLLGEAVERAKRTVAGLEAFDERRAGDRQAQARVRPRAAPRARGRRAGAGPGGGGRGAGDRAEAGGRGRRDRAAARRGREGSPGSARCHGSRPGHAGLDRIVAGEGPRRAASAEARPARRIAGPAVKLDGERRP